MTVYRYFLKTAFKNKGIILIYMVIFFALTALSSIGVDKKESQFLESRLTIGVLDDSDSELSNSLINYLREKNDVIDMKDEDQEYIKEQIFLETTDVVLVIPSDFVEKTIDKKESVSLYKDDRKMESMQAHNQINKFLIFANASYDGESFKLKDISRALNKEVDVKAIDGGNVENTSIAEWFRTYYNFISYALVGMYIAVIGLVMADFNEQKVFDRAKISSKSLLGFNIEIYLGQLTIATFISFVFIMGSIILKGKYIGEVNFNKYVINTITFSFTILCLTFLINNLTGNKFVINGVSVVFSLGSSFISGVMVAQEFLGEKTLSIARFLPNYYFVKINDSVTDSIFNMKFEMAMQLLFALMFLLMGIYFSRARQKV